MHSSNNDVCSFRTHGVVLVVLAAVFNCSRSPDTSDAALRKLIDVAARADVRTVEGYLSPFPHRPYRPPVAHDDARVLLLKSRALGLRSQGSDEEAATANALAGLIAGDHANAMGPLRTAALNNPTSAMAWNNLSVALLEAGQQGDAQAIVGALAASERAQMLDPRLAAAHFNGALALRAIHLDAAAEKKFATFLQLEGRTGWSTEARAHLRRSRRPDPAVHWRRIETNLTNAINVKQIQRVAMIVRTHRQVARGIAEVEMLAGWGEAKLARAEVTAAARLEAAAIIADQIRAQTGDTLLSDIARCIRLAPPSASRSMAKAHSRYRKARQLQRDRRPTEALALLREAERLFDETNSPMSSVVRYWIANCLSDGDSARDALALVRNTRVVETHKNLQALLSWQEATILNRFGLFSEALSAYSNALAIFNAIGDDNSATYMLNAIAAMHANLGRSAEAWRLWRDGFRRATASGEPDLLYMVVTTAARSDFAHGRLDTAHVLLGIASEMPTRNPRLAFDVVLWRTLAAHRLKFAQPARAYLAVAHERALAVKDPVLRATVDNDLRLAAAMLTTDARRAIALWNEYINDAARRRDTFLMPRVLVERARAYRRSGDLARAKADLQAALEHVARRGSGVARPDYRDSYFATTESAVRELIDLIDRTEGSLAAFHAIEQWRGLIAQHPKTRAADQPARVVPVSLRDDRFGMTYISLDDRLLMFAIDGRGITVHRIALGRAVLRRMVETFAASVEAGVPDEGLSTRLYTLLIAPVRFSSDDRALAIAADDVLEPLPFCALIDPVTGRYLVERIAITHVTALIQESSARKVTAVPNRRALVVGDPAFERKSLDLARLPAARREALAISSLYGVSPLVGDAATKERVIAGLRASNTVHIAAHVVANVAEPERSFVPLARSSDEASALYLHEVVNLPLHHVDAVIIAGCRSAQANGSPRIVRSLAGAFVAAGAGNAVGALWDVDDAATARLSMHLHRRLLEGVGVPQAVRAVQIELLRSSDPRLRSSATWAALRTYSGS